MPRLTQSDCRPFPRAHSAPLISELRQFTTHKQLLDAHPELAALMPGAETPDPVSAEGRKLRRKLLAAGWPLQVRRDA